MAEEQRETGQSPENVPVFSPDVLGFVGEPDPSFAEYGYIRPRATRSGKPREPAIKTTARFAFQLRYLFDPGSRAEVMPSSARRGANSRSVYFRDAGLELDFGKAGGGSAPPVVCPPRGQSSQHRSPPRGAKCRPPCPAMTAPWRLQAEAPKCAAGSGHGRDVEAGRRSHTPSVGSQVACASRPVEQRRNDDNHHAGPERRRWDLTPANRHPDRGLPDLAAPLRGGPGREPAGDIQPFHRDRDVEPR